MWLGAFSGARAALAAPAIAMAATFIAFGTAVREAGLSAGWALAAAWGIYGMPGQLIVLQAVATGGGIAAAVMGAVAVNSRFLPMAVALSPWLRRRENDPLPLLAAPFVSITPWAAAMRALPGEPVPARLPWFLGFALTSWLLGGAAAVAGHALAAGFPAPVRDALVFANPLYFALLMAADLTRPGPRRGLIAGALAAPLALLLPPAWGLLAAGLLGGSVAFLIGRARG
jgi:predicted branched-subunit amino acid permease